MAVFTVVIQNTVSFGALGAATSDLTLFRQIGRTVSITFASTLFRNFLSWDAIRTQLIGAGASARLVAISAPDRFDSSQLANVAGSRRACGGWCRE